MDVEKRIPSRLDIEDDVKRKARMIPKFFGLSSKVDEVAVFWDGHDWEKQVQGWVGWIKSSVLSILNLRCLLDIQVHMLSVQLDISVCSPGKQSGVKI